MAARVDGNRRYGLLNTDLAIRSPDGTAEKRKFETPAQLAEALTQIFGIALPEGGEEVLTRLFERKG